MLTGRKRYRVETIGSGFSKRNVLVLQVQERFLSFLYKETGSVRWRDAEVEDLAELEEMTK